MEFRGHKLTVPKMLIKRLLKIFGKTLNIAFSAIGPFDLELDWLAGK